jgi:signal transduction histidine kinase
MALPLALPVVRARSRMERADGPATNRPIAWVSTLLYVAVLVAGLYYDFVSGDGPHLARMAGFAVVLAVLIGLDVVERRRYVARTPTRPAVVLLATRALLLVAVAAVDGAGLSRPLFVLIPFTAYFAFGRPAGLALATTGVGVLLGGFVLTVPGWHRDLEHVSDVLMFTIGLMLALSMAEVAAREQQARSRLEQTLQELEASHARLTAYAERVAALSAATERNRLARDIHDSLGHHLTAVAVQVEKASAFRDRDAAVADQALRDARASARRALDDVRRSVHTLRDDAAFPLSDALDELVAQVRDEGLMVTLHVSGDQLGYDGASVTALYRAAQEALTNARRHAAASRVDVTVAFTESAARLEVADDGRGLSVGGNGVLPVGHRGFGLLGMRERVHLVGGRVEVSGDAGTGTRVSVTIPRAAAEAMPSPPAS